MSIHVCFYLRIFGAVLCWGLLSSCSCVPGKNCWIFHEIKSIDDLHVTFDNLLIGEYVLVSKLVCLRISPYECTCGFLYTYIIQKFKHVCTYTYSCTCISIFIFIINDVSMNIYNYSHLLTITDTWNAAYSTHCWLFAAWCQQTQCVR